MPPLKLHVLQLKRAVMQPQQWQQIASPLPSGEVWLQYQSNSKIYTGVIIF
jgi:hypothetical protein